MTSDRQALAVVDQLRSAWPPTVPAEARGYRPLDLSGTAPLAATRIGRGQLVAVAARRTGPPFALPCVQVDGGWQVAEAGEGVAAALLSWAPAPEDRFSFELAGPLPARGSERSLGTDQSNISVVVDDEFIVKWRSVPDADGRRATRLRRHLSANGFRRAPALLGSLTWADDEATEWILADVDAYLAGAEDGWDHAIELLQAGIGSDGEIQDHDFPATYGALTAELHHALARPSGIIAATVRAATPSELTAMRDGGLELLARARDIDAADQDVFRRRVPRLREAIDAYPADTTTLGHIHGDLHIGQLVAWRDGLAVIDFDGAPTATAPAGDHDAYARDVAQSVCSLWALAAVVESRLEGSQGPSLASWATRAEERFLAAYRAGLGPGMSAIFDERLLEPLIAEQLCRELVYADAVLPRWRYAPLRALRWRYPEEA